MEETIKELIELLQSASPIIWQALLKQAHNEAAMLLIWSVILTPVVALSAIWSIKFTKENDPIPEILAGAWIMTAILATILIQIVMAAYLRLSNPEFYALKYFLDGLAQK